MNEIVNKFLIAGDKFMPEKAFKRARNYIYSACGRFTKKKERIKIFKETGYSRCIYQNGQDQASFQHEMAYGDFKDLTRRTTSYKRFCDIAFSIAKNKKNMMDIKEILLQWFINCLIKRLPVQQLKIKIYLLKD